MVMSPSTGKHLPDDHLFLPLSKQWQRDQQIWPTSSTQGHTTLRIWVDQEDVSPEVPFTLITVPKLVLTHLCLPWVPWPLRSPYNDGWVWSGTPEVLVNPGINRCRDPLAPWLGFPDWVISAGRESRAITLGPPLGSQFGFSTYEVKSLGHFSQHHLHLGRMNINKTWGMAELRKQSGNI